jgi:hypothetical protein
MKVVVHGTVPVEVVIDTDTGTVEQAVVDDEQLSLAAPGVLVPAAVTDFDKKAVDDDTSRKALSIFHNNDVEWPSWQFGW